MQCSEYRVCIPCSVEGSGDSNCEEFDPLKITMFTSSMCTIVTFKVQMLRCLPKIFLGRISLFFVRAIRSYYVVCTLMMCFGWWGGKP